MWYVHSHTLHTCTHAGGVDLERVASLRRARYNNANTRCPIHATTGRHFNALNKQRVVSYCYPPASAETTQHYRLAHVSQGDV